MRWYDLGPYGVIFRLSRFQMRRFRHWYWKRNSPMRTV